LAGVETKLKPIPIWMAIASGEARFDRDTVRYAILDGRAAGGRLEGHGTARREQDRWRHAVVFKLEGSQMDLIYDQLRSERRFATGTLFSRGTLDLETAQGKQALPTLRGRLSVRFEGGSLSRYPALVRIFALLGTPVQLYRLPDLTREQMPYRLMSADFTVTDGIMHTENLLLDSDALRLSAVGKLRLADQTVDLNLAVRPFHALERGIRKLPLLGRILPEEQGLAVTYFRMNGPWADPHITLSPAKSLSKTVVDILLLPLRAPERVISPTR
jgi:uncharacterized protein YhdP